MCALSSMTGPAKAGDTGRMLTYEWLCPGTERGEGVVHTCRGGLRLGLVSLALSAILLRLILDAVHLLLLGQELLQPHLCDISASEHQRACGTIMQRYYELLLGEDIVGRPYARMCRLDTKKIGYTEGQAVSSAPLNLQPYRALAKAMARVLARPIVFGALAKGTPTCISASVASTAGPGMNTGASMGSLMSFLYRNRAAASSSSVWTATCIPPIQCSAQIADKLLSSCDKPLGTLPCSCRSLPNNYLPWCT